MTVLDRESPIPLYFQLKQLLLEKIEQGEWRPGDLIPSEQELQDSYGLSRTTVRQTLSELVNEGRLDRQRGRGTFVTKPKFTHDPSNRLGASDYLRQQGIEPGWQLLEVGWASPDEEVNKKLGLTAVTSPFFLTRLRLANGEPIGYHIAYLPPFVAEHINEKALEEGGSLRYLRSVPQMATSKAARTIEATAATKREAELLGIKIGDPILQIERLLTAEDGTPLELLWASYRGDRFKYQVTL